MCEWVGQVEQTLTRLQVVHAICAHAIYSRACKLWQGLQSMAWLASYSMACNLWQGWQSLAGNLWQGWQSVVRALRSVARCLQSVGRGLRSVAGNLRQVLQSVAWYGGQAEQGLAKLCSVSRRNVGFAGTDQLGHSRCSGQTRWRWSRQTKGQAPTCSWLLCGLVLQRLESNHQATLA